MTDELKPCPFCGASGEKVLQERSDEVRVGCSNTWCNFQPSYYAHNGTVTESGWNIRPAEDALRAELEELRRRNNRLAETNAGVEERLAWKARRVDDLEVQIAATPWDALALCLAALDYGLVHDDTSTKLESEIIETRTWFVANRPKKVEDTGDQE